MHNAAGEVHRQPGDREQLVEARRLARKLAGPGPEVDALAVAAGCAGAGCDPAAVTRDGHVRKQRNIRIGPLARVRGEYATAAGFAQAHDVVIADESASARSADGQQRVFRAIAAQQAEGPAGHDGLWLGRHARRVRDDALAIVREQNTRPVFSTGPGARRDGGERGGPPGCAARGSNASASHHDRP